MVTSIDEMIKALRGAADVAYSEDICLFLEREDCAKIADLLERLREPTQDMVTAVFFNGGDVRSEHSAMLDAAFKAIGP